MPPALHEVSRRSADDGQTVKWLWQLHDGAQVETVLMHYPDRVTVCVSTQAGCAMACQFCATGQAGFQRQLSAGEIVEQVAEAIREARPRRLSNVVFMGMGEPLANYDRVWSAVTRLHGDMGLSARHLTLSTVGVVPGIHRLAAASLPVNLAVSLHAANDEKRDILVPLNRRYPLSVLAEACARYVEATHRRLSIEWAMIHDVNDQGSDAVELAQFARPLGAHVNLIPLNPTPGYAVRGSTARRVREFRDHLESLGVNATVRMTRGRRDRRRLRTTRRLGHPWPVGGIVRAASLLSSSSTRASVSRRRPWALPWHPRSRRPGPKSSTRSGRPPPCPWQDRAAPTPSSFEWQRDRSP